MNPDFWSKNKQVLLYGVALAVLLFLLKWLELSFVIIRYSFEIYAGAIALVFTILGIWLALKLTKPRVTTITVEKVVFTGGEFCLNESMLKQLRISVRELEVLQLMSQGLSNREIGERLFISLNTIKTHSANLFLKLEVERRTQAVEKGKRLKLIA
jgi:NarL family two-component system response regulator LiaR